MAGRNKCKRSQDAEDSVSSSESTDATSDHMLSLRAYLDVLNTEFIYYSAVLRIWAPALCRDSQRTSVRLWINKLFGPEYHSSVLKPKRNRYLFHLTIIMFNDETHGILKQPPSSGVLPELEDLFQDDDTSPAAWELETQWNDTLDNVSEDRKQIRCPLHLSSSCPTAPEGIASLLDTEFHFFLWLARPYISLMQDIQDKTKAACWVEALCIQAPDDVDCPELKGLRNDYMQTLLGYVFDLRLAGPFVEFPPEGPLPPLADTVKPNSAAAPQLTDPASAAANAFLASLPAPENGAFAYLAVTGELFDTN